MISLLQTSLVTCLIGIVTAQKAPSQYAPSFVACPSDLGLRNASSGLSPQEKEWRKLRFGQVANSMGSYLTNANIPGFNVSAYVDAINASNVPVVGMAISGGGSQSGMNGLGIWQAFDDRYEPSVKAGTGGLVQCLSYLTGLSGGAIWSVGPIASNNFSSLEDIRKGSDLTTNYVKGKTGNTTEYYDNIFRNAIDKQREGFPVAVTDVFAQTVAHCGGSRPCVHSWLGSLPIVLLTEVIPGISPNRGNILVPDPKNSTIYEETPFEFGSWIGGRVQGFMPTKFLGTAMKNGRPSQPHCVNGFDKLIFAMASSSNAWDAWWVGDFYNDTIFTKRDDSDERARPSNSTSIQIPPAWADNFQIEIVVKAAKVFNQTVNQTLWATYPNPFQDFNKEMQNVHELLVFDGSEGGETIPLRALTIPEREVDFIIAFDSSSDNVANQWVNGTTFEYNFQAAKSLGIPFPEVPDAATFINLGMNQYPTFFGCPATSSSMSTPQPGPLVLYVPNAPWSAYTNFTYTMAAFTDNQLDLIFNNSLNAVSFGRGQITQNPKFPALSKQFEAKLPRFSTCVACGAIYKSLLRVGASLPEACEACFAAHCWNGTVVNDPVELVYSPDLILDPKLTFAKWNASLWSVKG